MTDPKRNDIFEDANGMKVAVKQLYPPNALGVSFVEYKNLSDSNLRFLPKEQFLEGFRWVDNFGSTDTFVKVVLEKEAKSIEAEEAAKAAEATGESDSPAEATEAAEKPTDDGVRTAAPTRSS
ncbi:hypothetical protein [Polynucleobacter sp. AP-Ainpum-60-G11]|uniref:hypothetical protein n=1 Tax=Polynucleobacter sp. AP-Ainpum-60-G11 TaxID=2576926 RepID=UPI001BFD0CCE|nr:hypothetical protein [Polynucleobacter sp. AP-Ainpum-60-G11]QWE27192.1 hypothetical protein FD971_02560 [Polynucleobacter sp. AP-Ainpum-60-G11]